MRYVPHEYQEYAKEFIIREKVSALFLDCGLGKTVITLTAVWELLFDYFDIRKVLVIAPLRVARDTWGGELEKWEHLSGIGLSKVLGPEKERLAALEREAQVYVINRENVEWLVDSCRWEFDMVVIDELSSFKSHRAKRFKALKRVRPKVRRIVGLTGTPAPNGLIDLWAEIGLLDMGQRLGRFIGGYRERFFLPDKRSRQMVFSYKPRDGAEEAIYGLISDICISMRACDYLDMPECVYNRVEVAMSGRETELYERLERDMLLPFADGDIAAVNAAGLSNICIFSTMLLITLTCTVTLWSGMDQIAYYDYPYDCQADYSEHSNVTEKAREKAEELALKYGQGIERLDVYNVMNLTCGIAPGSNVFTSTAGFDFADQYGVTLLTLDDYNRLEGQDQSLEEDEVLVYSTGTAFSFDRVNFMGVEASVKGEPERIYPYPQAKNRMFNFTSQYVMVVKDEVALERFAGAWADVNGVTDLEDFLHRGVRRLCLLLDGKETDRDAFVEEWSRWCQGQQDFLRIENGLEGRDEDRSMNGGLLFIGMVFGILFFMCFLLIMYFKQVSEGYEDQNSFEIMQKVGMSDGEIKGTIHRQILLVFFLPLAGALLHTAAGLVMVNGLLAALRLFDTGLLIRCCAGVAAAVTLLYGSSYLMTARTYYRIVKR